MASRASGRPSGAFVRGAERSRSFLELAGEVAEAINEGLPLGDVLQVMAGGLQQIVGLRWGSVSLLDETHENLESRALSPAVETALDRSARLSVKGSLMGWVVLSQRALVIEEVETAAALPEQQVLLREGLRSVAIVPLVLKDKVIGTLNLASSKAGAFKTDDQPTLALLSQFVALALGRARADVVKRRSATLELLSEVGRLAQSTRDVDGLLGEVVKLLREHFHAAYVAISVFETHRIGATLRAASYADRVHGPPVGSVRALADTLVRQVVHERRTAIVESPEEAHRPLCSGTWAQVVLGLRTADRVRGVLEVAREAADPFSPEELAVLETVSDRVAGALDTAALFLELERSNRELSGARDELAILYEIGRVATSTLDLDKILAPVARMVCESFGYDLAAIFLVHGEELDLRACARRESGEGDGEIRPDTVKLRLLVSSQANAASLVRDVARGRETLVVSNMARSGRAQPLMAQTVSSAAIPLKVGTLLAGVLCVESVRANAFDLEDVRILETLADQLASAIDNARLYRELLAANEKQAQTFRELRSVQDDLLQATRLAALGEMSGRVAHEVLNPITAVLARVQGDLRRVPSPERSGIALLRRIVERWLEAYRTGKLREVMDEELARKGGERYLAVMAEILAGANQSEGQIREDLAFVERHCLRIVKIVDSLRGLARQSRTRERGSVVPILRESVELVRDASERRSVQILETYPDSLPDVEVDPSELVQVFSNVLRNALQAMEPLGRPGRIHVEATYREPHLEVRIRDTGTGIRPEDVPRLFDPDFTTKDRTKGTGLGLSIARRFLRGYGGDITLEWTGLGEGSVFLLTIPKAGNTGASAAEAGPAA